MLRRSIYDFKPEEINRVVKLLKSNYPIKAIRKKTGIDFNDILFIAKLNKINLDPKFLSQFDIYDRTLIIADNHLGSPYEIRKYLDFVYNYAVVHNIRTILHCGDLLQGIIEPNKYDLDKQIDMFLKYYPKIKNMTTYLLCGNHEFRSFINNEEAFNEFFSRKDIKYLGFAKAYLRYHEKFISLTHYISKYYIDIPYIKSFVEFAGHHHYLKVDKNQIYVPTLSRDLKKKNNKAGLLEMYTDRGHMIVEAKEVSNRVNNKGIIFDKRM